VLSEEALFRLAHSEANVAVQVGLSVALGEHLALGPDRIQARLAEVGALTRTALAGVAGWQVVEPVAEISAITTLIPPDGLDPQTVRSWLIAERRVLTTYIGPERAPMELIRPALRISPHVDVSVGDLEVLAEALSAATAASKRGLS
jgi:pyridoxal 5-phosphate dependent beta-lyase